MSPRLEAVLREHAVFAADCPQGYPDTLAKAAFALDEDAFGRATGKVVHSCIALWQCSFTQHFLFIDNRRKIESRKTHLAARPPLNRLRRRFAPLRGTQRRCAALRAAPPGRYAPRALRAQPFLEHEKKA